MQNLDKILKILERIKRKSEKLKKYSIAGEIDVESSVEAKKIIEMLLQISNVIIAIRSNLSFVLADAVDQRIRIESETKG